MRGRNSVRTNDLCCVFDAEQSIRLAAPPACDGRERDLLNGSTTTSTADRRLLTSAAMFASKLATTTADQYEQFVRLQQLLMHVQTGAMLPTSDNGAQVNSLGSHSVTATDRYRPASVCCSSVTPNVFLNQGTFQQPSLTSTC